MSRNNKVNPDHYTMAGRLSADDLARERMRQGEQQPGGGRRGRKKAMPPWLAQEPASGGAGPAGEGSGTEDDGNDANRNDDNRREDSAAQPEGAGMPRRQSARKQGAAASRKGEAPTRVRKSAGARKSTAARTSSGARKARKASGATGTAKTRKRSSARGGATRSASARRVGRPAAGKKTKKK